MSILTVQTDVYHPNILSLERYKNGSFVPFTVQIVKAHCHAPSANVGQNFEPLKWHFAWDLSLTFNIPVWFTAFCQSVSIWSIYDYKLRKDVSIDHHSTFQLIYVSWMGKQNYCWYLNKIFQEKNKKENNFSKCCKIVFWLRFFMPFQELIQSLMCEHGCIIDLSKPIESDKLLLLTPRLVFFAPLTPDTVSIWDTLRKHGKPSIWKGAVWTWV